jgi:hypothetical protein
MIINPITKKSEFFYDFVLRHSLYRPRDLMLIGGKIAQIPARLRTQEQLRAAVDQAAGEIVWHYLAEMRGLTEVPDRSLFGLIPSNVLERRALKRIAETYVARLEGKRLQASNAHYIRAFHTRNVIGHDNRWREGKIFKCAAKGDLSRYSRVLSDPVVGEHLWRLAKHRKSR